MFDVGAGLGSFVVNGCRPFGAWNLLGLMTRGRRFALTPGYMLSPLRGLRARNDGTSLICTVGLRPFCSKAPKG
jgi:hypothetical protein